MVKFHIIYMMWIQHLTVYVAIHETDRDQDVERSHLNSEDWCAMETNCHTHVLWQGKRYNWQILSDPAATEEHSCWKGHAGPHHKWQALLMGWRFAQPHANSVCLFAVNAKTTEWIDTNCPGITKNNTENVLCGLKSPVLVFSGRYSDISAFPSRPTAAKTASTMRHIATDNLLLREPSHLEQKYYILLRNSSLCTVYQECCLSWGTTLKTYCMHAIINISPIVWAL